MPSAAMELKVWVDGIQRVVSGATYDTTCQDVVLALAHATKRTGRFSLTEKWRDRDRPLTPAERPVHILQQWGELSSEVRFVLHRMDDDDSQDKLLRWKRDNSLFSHNFTLPSVARDNNVKRSLTFSGAHNATERHDSAAPTSKVRKTHVPNGDVRRPAGVSRLALPAQQSGLNGSQHPVPPPRRRGSPVQPPGDSLLNSHASSEGNLRNRNDKILPTPPSVSAPFTLHSHRQSPLHVTVPSASQPSPAPLALPRARLAGSSPRPGPGSEREPHSSEKAQGLSSFHPASLPQAHSHPQPVLPQQSVKHQQSVNQLLQPQVQRPGQQQRDGASLSKSPTLQSSPKSLSPSPPPLPSQPPPRVLPSLRTQQGNSQPSPRPGQAAPAVETVSALSSVALITVETTLEGSDTVEMTSSSSTEPLVPVEATLGPSLDALVAVEATLYSPDHSRQASLEIEEYDLERNFPDVHREAGRSERPSVSLEYRLEEGLGSGQGSGSGSGSGQLEGERAKVLRLVTMQQEQLKTQESQISLIHTEITALEEKEEEYEERLRTIMEELLLQENRQRDIETQLHDLDQVEWDNVLDGEKKCEVDQTLQITSLKAQILEHEHRLDDVRTKETELLKDLKEEEEKAAQEEERLQAEEHQAKELKEKTKEEISLLQTQCGQTQRHTEECEASLSSVDADLQGVQQDLENRESQLSSLEQELKAENLKDISSAPASSKADSAGVNAGGRNNEEMIRRLLEERLSPRLVAASNRTSPSPAAPAFMANLTAKNQSDVWV